VEDSDFDCLYFSDYSYNEIAALLMIICEIECNFRECHKTNFFEDFFLDKHQDEISNDKNLEAFLEKFKKVEIKDLKVYTDFVNYKEIVEFFDGNLTVLFTKFEFLFQEIKKNGIQKNKSRFFSENTAFELNERFDFRFKRKELNKKNMKTFFEYNSES
jgi:hypothetical protein